MPVGISDGHSFLGSGMRESRVHATTNLPMKSSLDPSFLISSVSLSIYSRNFTFFIANSPPSTL